MIVLAMVASFALTWAAPQDGPRAERDAALLITPERSGYQETSTHEDVWNYLELLQTRGAPIRVESIGRSAQGREIPLAVACGASVGTPAEARRCGLPIVYVQANIHGAEVEGKESALRLLRELLEGDPNGWLDRLVLLVAPIYNCDGNEQWGDVAVHRPSQNGPARVGLRPNGQELDLNRDCTKAESPEMRALLANVYDTWDPDVVLDLHTTDGTRHGYGLTYAPPLHPDTEKGVLRFARDELLPAVRERLRASGLETMDYGNLPRGDSETAWYTFGWEGRYVTNYAGLRNRIGILSEATSYSTFEDRIDATDRFVREVLRYVAEHAPEVVACTREADRRVAGFGADPQNAPAMGLRFEMQSRGEEEVLLEDREGRPPGPVPVTEIRAVTMPVYDRFAPTHTRALPAAYVFSAAHTAVAELLHRHGIVVEQIRRSCTTRAECFAISRVARAARAYQGHREITLEGDYAECERTLAEGDFLVRTAQPLGILIFQLLEAESQDGAIAWGAFGEDLSEGGEAPILRLRTPPALASRRWQP